MKSFDELSDEHIAQSMWFRDWVIGFGVAVAAASSYEPTEVNTLVTLQAETLKCAENIVDGIRFRNLVYVISARVVSNTAEVLIDNRKVWSVITMPIRTLGPVQVQEALCETSLDWTCDHTNVPILILPARNEDAVQHQCHVLSMFKLVEGDYSFTILNDLYLTPDGVEAAMKHLYPNTVATSNNKSRTTRNFYPTAHRVRKCFSNLSNSNRSRPNFQQVHQRQKKWY
jgi:hypothetical protein